MKVVKKINVLGQYAKPGEDFKDSEKIEILDGGTETVNKHGPQTVYKIRTQKGEFNMGFNQTTTNNLIDAFGDETDGWIGKRVNNVIMKVMIGGELKTVVYLYADGWKMDNKGKFHGPDSQTSDSSEGVVQLNEKPEINPDDIPF